MGFCVVCISRTTAAGGETVGQAVAQQLGFQYVDEQIIERAAQQAQVEPRLVAKAEHRQPLLQRLLEKMKTGTEMAGVVTLATGVSIDAFVPSLAASGTDADDLRVMIRAAIHEVAGAGQAVIVAHAASMALANTEGVLRVLVTASTETRIRRVAELGRIIREEAERRIATSDRERREYFQRFYKVQEELATHYDLVINTDVLTTAQAVEVVLTAARAPA
ncbi:MAG: cytidylate kinase-like family protein [Deltaproteobacteria bacterium]|nr:cytidylate kinase-like family protein [Deltaproteobacteria bacterium]